MSLFFVLVLMMMLSIRTFSFHSVRRSNQLRCLSSWQGSSNFRRSNSNSNGDEGSDGAVPTPGLDGALRRLEGMRLAEIKELMRKMGGKPGNKNKSELVVECHMLLLQSTSAAAKLSGKAAAAAVGAEEEKVEEETAQSQQQQQSIETLFQRPGGASGASLSRKAGNPASAGGGSMRIRDLPPLQSSSSNSSHGVELADLGVELTHKHPYGVNRNSRFNTEQETADMDVTFLGTASCVPSISRGVSCVAFRTQSETWLFDCGEASQLQLQKSRVRASKITKIFITHSHGDHSFGLPGVLCLIGQATQEERQAAGNEASKEEAQPIDIYGPEGIRDFIRATIQLSYSRVCASFRVHELKNVPYLHGRFVRFAPPVPNVKTRFEAHYGEQEGGRSIYPDENGHYHLFEEGELTVKAAPMQHTVPCVGFVVSEANRVGRLKVEEIQPIIEKHKTALATKYGLRDANKIYGVLKQIKSGEKFELPDGTELNADDVLDPPRRGRKVVFMGDTCTGEHIASLATGADVLVHEATNAWFRKLDSDRYSDYKKLERDTFAHGHSTPQMAGRFAHLIKAKRLILTHFSPRYRGDEDLYNMRTMWAIEDMARQTCSLKRKNDIIAAWDQLTIAISSRVED